MKSWQDWLTTISDWFRANPAAFRWAGVAVILLVLVLLLGNYSFQGARTVSLFDSRELTSDEIGLMQVAFGRSGLNEYEIKGSQIEVPRTLRGDYLKSLSDHNSIPHDLTAHLETQSSFDFFQTRAQHRTQQIARKKQTIREMVMQLRFVDRAIVDYDETRGATPFEDLQRTAVVNVTPSSSRMLERTEIKAIRDTVRGAVAGLQVEDITIIDTFASRSYTGLGESASETMPPHTATKMQAERKYENKIRSALTAYPGIRVNVEVTVDPVIRRYRDERNVDGDPVVVSRTVQRETSSRVPAASPSTDTNAFNVGANGQARIQPGAFPVERSTETTQTVANSRFETTETAGLTVTGVSVSIGIPERCVEDFVDRDINSNSQPTTTVNQLRKDILERLQNDIRQKVSPLIPGVVDIQNDPHRIVITMDQEIPQTDPIAEASPLHWSSRYWPVLGLLGLGLGLGLGVFALTIIRPSGRARASSLLGTDPTVVSDTLPVTLEPLFDRPLPASVAGIVLPEPVTAQASVPNSTEPAGGEGDDVNEQIRTQLDQWCRENPDAAAATIRQWLERKAG